MTIKRKNKPPVLKGIDKILLGELTRYDLMEESCRWVEKPVSIVYCGYLRQPIYSKKLTDINSLGVAGACALKDYRACYRVIDESSDNPLFCKTLCDTYVKRLLKNE